jgi:F-type H+-transporting ATPase subunit alpha
MAVRGQDITSVIKRQIEEFGGKTSMVDVGVVVEVGDGIAHIDGLAGAKFGEFVEFSGSDSTDPVVGMALNLGEDIVGVAILGDDTGIKEGDTARSTGELADVPVGKALIGRVVDALGQPIDGKGPIKASDAYPVERLAPNVVTRKPVDTPVQTGIKAIDSMIPLGRGQRQLIIGDRFTGKSAIAIDTIINQRSGDLMCIYVAIGQKASKVAQVVATLEQYGAMEHTVVVAANASDPAPLQYLAPYAGCAIAEEIMSRGQDALIVYDDLTKHAWAYRQISLLLRRPPGREAYPGDVFYLHSRLLERAAKMDDSYGGGSITALPIIETQAGDVSAYIPTNVISITDGQIYLETDLFNSGIRPAVNVGNSVSRVGGSAQTKAMRRVAGRLRLDLAQFRELATFAQFGTADLDPATRRQLERGQRITEVLKQPQYEPMELGQQVCIMYAVINGFLDDVPIVKVKSWETEFHVYMEAAHPEIRKKIMETRVLDDELEGSLKAAIEEFKEAFSV